MKTIIQIRGYKNIQMMIFFNRNFKKTNKFVNLNTA